ncbi:hypothetical protein Vadar_017189 [Vaccinium darrowii]|uniref:Uncharacterized protein n=1 Tax=Vaccinium darrowii TaxID=229202 RepID=A0ACB7Z4D4_9ERIC|nr:hypothetical protein Vadar_017189 [Vaccinium darrowii]
MGRGHRLDPLTLWGPQPLHTPNPLFPSTSNYTWKHKPFNISFSSSSSPFPHLHDKLRYGDNLDDEWFIVFLLLQTSLHFPNLYVRVFYTNSKFQLIESAFHLPRWLNPDSSSNCLFTRRDSVQSAIKNQIRNYPGDMNMHKVRVRVKVRVPISVAQVLKNESCLILLLVEGFYDLDIDSMKYATKMERFYESREETVEVCARMSRAMYAQLVE